MRWSRGSGEVFYVAKASLDDPEDHERGSQASMPWSSWRDSSLAIRLLPAGQKVADSGQPGKARLRRSTVWESFLMPF
jgi:hypothetical protein